MAYPDLYHDESRILEAQNIKVKSVSFNAVLTNRRLILIDNRKGTMPVQEILLATLKNIDGGENAIRDPTITLSIITNTGTTRQMILTFPKMSGGERKREADEWVKALRQNLSHPFEHPVLPDIPAPVYEDSIPVPESAPVSPQPPRIEIVNAPPQKKRIEISRPMKKIIESEPAMPKPVETTSLPVGSFCNRCGSRVPPESAFCNRCGTPVVKESDLDAARVSPVIQHPPAPQAPAPQPQPLPPEIFIQPVPEPAPGPAPEVPQVAVPLPPVFGQSADKKERPIEQVIHSIEPLIEDSVPRTEPAPLIPRTTPLPVPEPVVAEPPAAPVPPTAEENVQWPVITPPPPAEPGSPAGAGEPLAPPPGTGASPGRGKTIAIALLAIVIIAAIAGVFIFANPLQMVSTVTPTPTPAPTMATPVQTMPVTQTVTAVTTTPAPETPPIPTTAPASAIPATGVWVRVMYANQFSGQVGTPNAQREVSDTGEKLYQISTSTGTVAASVQKVDGSADLLAVEVYKDGELITKKSTVAPKGIVEIQVSLKPSPTPTPTFTLVTTTPATTPAANSTANETAAP